MTSTEVVRRFGDVLAEIKHGGKSIVVTKSGEAVAELRPVVAPRGCNLREFAELWGARNMDDDDGDRFAEDLATVNSADQPGANPWA